MKKIALVVAILALVVPAMAATSVVMNAVDIDGGGGGGVVAITYNVTGGDVSGFGLDINVPSGKTITAIGNFYTGEGKGYGIFPGTINIDDTNGVVKDYGTPVAPSTDPGALGGLGTSGITIELGALYTTGNAPNRAGTLCTVTVSASCNIKVALNVTRGGVVDVNYAVCPNNLPITRPVYVVSLCTVPNIVGSTKSDANTAIVNAGLTVGTISESTHATIKRGKVMSQNPTDGGNQIACGGAVNYTVSQGCYTAVYYNDYNMWVAVGEPNSWCYPRQCHGDVDNAQQGDTKTGFFYVWSTELNTLLAGWKQPYGGNPVTQPWIAADFTHSTDGDTKTGFFRVWSGDLNILLANWKSNPLADCN